MTYDVLDAARRATIRRGGAATAAVLALAILTAVVILAITRPARTGPGTASPAGASATTAPAPAGGPATSANTPAAVVLPADLAFAEVAGVALPTSASAGPYDTTAGQARGFRHDPAGAVLAAVHLFVRCTPQVGPSVFDPTLREQVTGPDAAAMREQVATAYERLRERANVPYGRPVGALPATLAGFRVEQYRLDTAVLSVLTRATDRAGTAHHAATTVTLAWTGTDWALVAPPGGGWDAAVRIVDTAQAATFTTIPGSG